MEIPHSRPSLGAQEAEAVRRIVLSGQLAQGPETALFEADVAAWTGRAHAVAVSSGTTALALSLLALEVGPGDEVIITSYACTALVHAVWAVGAVPVAADIELSSRNLDPAAVRDRITPRTRALIVPHMFGLPARVQELVELGPPVIEDCAMSLGAMHRGRPVGAWGRLSVCSFYATKMVAAGEGGMVLTDDPRLAEAVRARREYDGRSCSFLRLNAKTTDLCSAVGRIQLGRLPEFLKRRRELSQRYYEALNRDGLTLPCADPEHVYFRYVVGCRAGADAVAERLVQHGVAARRPVPRLLHRELGGADATYPNATAAHAADLSLPLYPALTDREAEHVITVTNERLLEIGRRSRDS